MVNRLKDFDRNGGDGVFEVGPPAQYAWPVAGLIARLLLFTAVVRAPVILASSNPPVAGKGFEWSLIDDLL